MTRLRSVPALFGLAALLSTIVACAPESDAPPALPEVVTVTPHSATLATGESLVLSAVATRTGPVVWSVVQGPEGGAVTADGVYTAPEAPGTYEIVATSVADPAASASVVVTVVARPPPPPAGVDVAVVPATASVAAGTSLQLGAAVTGTADTAVTWLVQESGGGIVTADGLYQAPSTTGTFHVVATSRADPGKSDVATVTVTGGTTAPPPATPVDPTLRTVAEWEALFLGVWNNSHSQYLAWSTTPNSADYYDLAYPIDGLVAMFEASGKTQYLDRALLYVENVIADAVPSSTLPGSSFRDGYLAWPASSQYLSADQLGDEFPLYESYMWRYVARMLRAMHDDPVVYANPTYRAKYDAILAFTQQHIWSKWTSRGNVHVYRGNTHMASHWAYIALELWRLTGEQKYKTVLDDINVEGLPSGVAGAGHSLRHQMKPHPSDASAYTWSSSWGQTSPTQDVSHGNGVLSFIVESNRLGVEWSQADMQKFVRTLAAHVWVGTSFAYYVDGSGTSRTGWYPDGFVKLGRYDPALQKRIESGSGLSGKGVQFYGNAALNARILNGR